MAGVFSSFSCLTLPQKSGYHRGILVWNESHMEKTLVSFLSYAGREVPITETLAARPVFIVGSDARAALTIGDQDVAPAHAIITRKNTEYYVTPRFPNLDVLVNGKRVEKPFLLETGDVIQIGSTQLTFGQAEREGVPAAASIAPIRQTASVPTTRSVLVARPAAAAAATTSVGQNIYFPKVQAGPERMSLGTLISSIVVVLVVGAVLGFALLSSPGGVASAMSAEGYALQNFAYQDGNVSLVMFDADW